MDEVDIDEPGFDAWPSAEPWAEAVAALEGYTLEEVVGAEVVGHVKNKACTVGRRGPSGWLAEAGRGFGQPGARAGARKWPSDCRLAEVGATLLPT